VPWSSSPSLCTSLPLFVNIEGKKERTGQKEDRNWICEFPGKGEGEGERKKGERKEKGKKGKEKTK
jgi:hypothetical protein